MIDLQKIPATVVTGFLGSGKTTLLSHVIRQSGGKRIAVIVNEFGELDIDADLLRSCALDCESDDAVATDGDDGIYELANGCICCTVEEEFLPVMKRLVERRDSIDHILIETSGLALPKPLVQAFNWPEIKQFCTVDAVITVVDGPAVARGEFAGDADRVEAQRRADPNLDHDPSLEELFDDQLSSADMVVISKSDLVQDDALDRIQDRVSSRVRPGVRAVTARNGSIEPRLIMDLGMASEDSIEGIHTHHDHHHEHGEDHHHAHEDFSTVLVDLGEVDGDRLSESLTRLMDTEVILRVKGFLALPGKPMRQVLQGVGTRMDRYFDRPWGADEPRRTRLVFIGRDLSEAPIRSALEGAAAS